MSEHRKAWLDALRALAMLMVIIGHTCPGVRPFFTWTSPVKIPLFFAISGYLFRGSEKSFSSFALSRVRRLMVPYLGLSLLSEGAGLILRVLGKGMALSEALPERVRNILTGDALWFVPCLFLLELLLYWIHRAAKRSRRSKWIIHAGLTLLCMLASVPLLRPKDPLPWRPEVALLMVSFAQLGHLLRILEPRIRKLRAPALAGLLALDVGLLLLQAWLHVDGINVNTDVWPCLPLNLLTGAAGITFLFALFPRLPVPRPAAYIGRNTLVCYAFHHFAVSAFSWMLVFLRLPDPDGNFLTALLAAALTCAACAMPASIINRFCPWLAGRFPKSSLA